MASYKVRIKKSAEKELRAVPLPYLQKLVQKIKSLSENPRPHGCEAMKGGDPYIRIRQNDYRALYEVDDAKQEVIIIKIGHRREVYD